MNIQVKAFQLSFLIHTFLIAVVVALGLFFKSPSKMLVINFDLEPATSQVTESRPGPKSDGPKKQSNLRKEASLKKLPSILKESPPFRPSETPVKEPLSEPQPQVTPTTSELAAPISSPASKTGVHEGTAIGLTGMGGHGTGVGSTLSSGHSGGSVSGNNRGSGQVTGSIEDKAQNKYLREHFAYIRDKILGNIRYPATARRMGWQGRVLLSFIITIDGSIKDTKIIQSSGFELLDKNAAETVKNTAPFPKPPEEAKLVIPIMYQLN